MTTRRSWPLLAGMLILAACSKEAAEPPLPEPKVDGTHIAFPEPAKAPHIATYTAGLEASPKVRLNGRLAWDEDRTVRIFSPFAGRVMRITVQPGETVRKGQPLAYLGSPEFGQAQSEAARAQADVALAQKNLERQKELEEHGVAPRKDLQSAEADYARARAELDRARGRVRLYGSSASAIDQSFVITSPLAGVVAERNINPGQEVRPDQMTANAPPLFVITDPDYLWAILDATEKDLPDLKRGKTLTIHAPVYGDEGFAARIANISDFLDPATRTLKVRAMLSNNDRRLKAEMFVTAEMDAGAPRRLEVPARTVYFQDGRHYVFTEDAPARYTRREVSIGDQRDGHVSIVAGLQDGNRVVSDDVLMLQQMVQPRRVQK